MIVHVIDGIKNSEMETEAVKFRQGVDDLHSLEKDPNQAIKIGTIQQC